MSSFSLLYLLAISWTKMYGKEREFDFYANLFSIEWSVLFGLKGRIAQWRSQKHGMHRKDGRSQDETNPFPTSPFE